MKIEKASGSICMNCTFKFYFVIKIGTKDTNESLIVLYLPPLYFILAHGVIKYSLFNFSSQELRRSLVRWQDEWIVQNRSGRSGRI